MINNCYFNTLYVFCIDITMGNLLANSVNIVITFITE